MKTIRQIKSGFTLGALALGAALLPLSSAQAADLLVHFDFANGSLQNKGTLGGTAVINSGAQATPSINQYATGEYAYDATGASAMAGAESGSLSLSVGTGLNGLKSFTYTGWYKVDAGVDITNNTYLMQVSGSSDLRFNSNPRIYNTTWYGSSGVNNYVRQFTGASSTSTVATHDQWVFFAFTYNAITGAAEYMVGLSPDNIILTSHSIPLPDGQFVRDGSGSIVIGNNSADSAAFKGMLKDVRIYGSTTDGSGALSADFIKQQVMVPEASTYGLIVGVVCVLALARARRRK